MAQTSRPYSAAHFALVLGTQTDGGLFRSIEGGGVKTDVMTYQQGGIYDRWRQLGKVKFEDIKLQVGMSMSQIFYTWCEDFVAGKATRKDGAIIAADFYYKARARREFKNAMIKELAFPKLEGKDTGPAYMNVTVAVEDIVFQKGDESSLAPADMQDQKKWTACNFHFRIDGYNTVSDETS
jgi:phage tail-like protein